jgi:4-amino-4-deoxy-L-arabinose transferase-like glycosyltransferase
MNASRSGSRLVPYTLLFIFIGIGMFLVWYSTVWGAGLISDSFQYTAGARNFAHGNGFSLPYGNGELQPMTKYAPLFSFVLAGFELAGISVLQGARIINIILFGLNIFMVFYSTRRLAHSNGFALLAALLFATSFVTVEVHSWALSEPLYLSLSLAFILLIQKYFEENRASWLILAALAASAAFLTRYVGVSLVMTIGIILLLNRTALKQRVRDFLLFGGIAVLPIALWSLRGYLFTRTLNDRAIAFHPLTIKNYVSAIDVIYGWFFPKSLVQGAEKIFLALTAAALILLFLLFWKSRKVSTGGPIKNLNPEKKIAVLHGLYIVLYGLLIIASKTWIDPDIGLSDRILSPMLVSMLILLATGLSFLWNNYGKARPFIILAGLGLIAYYAVGTFATVQGFHDTGIGIARRGWHRSSVIQRLPTYSDDPIYTNSNSSLYLWSDRAGYSIPDFELLKEKGTDTRILLVIFHHVPPTGKRLAALVSGLKLIEEDKVASIYVLDP